MTTRPNVLVGNVAHLAWRSSYGPTMGAVRDMVTAKANSEAPEQPRVARVWLMRLADGAKAWEGYSASDGSYAADGLAIGHEYVPVGIDPKRDHQCVAAGPVRATPTMAVTNHPVIGQTYAAEVRVMGVVEPARVTCVGGLPAGVEYVGNRSLRGDAPAGVPGPYLATFEVVPFGAEAPMRIAMPLTLVVWEGS